jgi:hypothetical protein
MRSHRQRKLGRVGLAVLAAASAFATAATGATTAGAVPPPPMTGGACNGAIIHVPRPAHVSEVLFKDQIDTKTASIAACVDQNHLTKSVSIHLVGAMVPPSPRGCRLVVNSNSVRLSDGVVPCQDAMGRFDFTVPRVRANRRMSVTAIVYSAWSKPEVLRWTFNVKAR